MPESNRHLGQPAPAGFADCVREIDAARARLRATRLPGCHRSDERLLQADLLAALEAYAAAIAESGAPVPYGVRSAINLYRGLTQG